MDLTIGEQAYDLSSEFNVAAGPLDWITSRSFLPDPEPFEQMRSLVCLYRSDLLSCTVAAQLYAGEVPPMQVSPDERTSRLGFTSWVLTGESPATSVTFDASVTVVHEEQAIADGPAATVPDDAVYGVPAAQEPRI